MQTKDTVHLTLFVLSNQTVWLGYMTIKADDLWDRSRTRTSARLFFPTDEISLDWADSAMIEESVGSASFTEMDSDGWALAPELTVNLAHVLFARTIPGGEVPYKLGGGGNYLLKIGGEND